MARESRTNTKNRPTSRPSAAEALTFNVTGLLAEPAGSKRVLVVDAPPLDLGEELRQTRGVTGELRLIRTNRGLMVVGRMSTAIAQECSRCLKALDWYVELDLDEEALPSLDLATGQPVDTSAEPDQLRLNDHHELELEREVADLIRVAEPIAPLCRPDCPGLCIVCGAELAAGPHSHPDEEIDPRLEALKGFVGGDQPE
jgi:uncharacterized protein